MYIRALDDKEKKNHDVKSTNKQSFLMQREKSEFSS